jgi:hypothetical protein
MGGSDGMNPNAFQESLARQFIESISHQRNRLCWATILETQSLGNSTSLPTSMGTLTSIPPPDPGAGGSANYSGASSAVMAMSWPASAGFSAGSYSADSAEATTFPIDGFAECMPARNDYFFGDYRHIGGNSDYDLGSIYTSVYPFIDLTSIIWGGMPVALAGQAPICFGLSQIMCYVPQFMMTVIDEPSCLQNIAVATRGRYRINGKPPIVWQGICDLAPQYYLNSEWVDWPLPSDSFVWTPGVYWPPNATTGFAGRFHYEQPIRFYPVSVSFDQWITPLIYTGSNEAWNYPGDDTTFIPGNPSAFGAKMVFHCFEDPTMFSTRTGFSL